MPVDGDVVLKAGLDTTDVSKKMDSMQKTISRGLKNIIRVGFGVRSIFTLMRKLRKSLTEGFGDLAQVYEPFNESMSQIMTSLRLLRNTFASAFAPIIETVAPILSTFINMLAEAVAKVGQFIAALTGKEYVQAGTAYIDYAKSLDKSSKSSSNATKQTKKQTEAQKKLNREITHFDDLVILHDKNKDKTTTPTTNTSPASSTFTPMKIGDAISQFAKDFKAAWAKGDLTNIGNQVGEKLKTMLEHIPWEKIQAGARKIAKNIATFLNGFLETPGLFTEIGETVGNAINTALAALSTFAWNFHWDSLGTAISDAMKATMSTINWDDAFSAAEGFGRGFAEYLNALINPETFDLVGKTLANVLNTAFTFLANFGTTFDWVNFGNSLATGINSFLENLNIDEFSRGVKAFVYGIRDAIVTWLDTVNWYKFGTTLRDIIQAIPWTTILKSFGEIIWHAINAVIETAKGFFDTDKIGGPVANAFDTIQKTLKDFKDNVDLDALKKGFEDLINVLKPVGEGFASGFLYFFNRLFEIGKDFINALGPAMQDLADALGDMDPEVLKGIGFALGIIAAALVAMKLATGVAGIISALLGPLSGLASTASSAVAALGTGTAGAATGLAGSLFLCASGVGAFLWALEQFKITTASTTEELKPLNDAHADTLDIITKVGEQYGLSKEKIAELAWEVHGALDPHSDMIGTYQLLDKTLQENGIDVDNFKDSLSNACQVAKTQGKDISEVEGYISGVGTSATNAKDDTSGFASAFDVFDSLSIATPIKLLLLSTAIKNLGEKGVLSEEQVGELQNTLDNCDEQHPESAFNKVKTALDEAGVSAGEFNGYIATAMQEIPRQTQTKMSEAAKTILDAGTDFEKNGESSGGKATQGLTKGLKDGEDDVQDASNHLGFVSLLGMNGAFDSHSPSKETEKIGGYAGEGLKIGIENSASMVETASRTLASKTLAQFNNIKSSFNTVGHDYMTSLYNGLNKGGSSLYRLARDIANDIYDAFDDQGWYSLGDNIGTGIYNGLYSDASWLETLAWNTAVKMYNAACDALDVASPSKKFAWIGQMITQGWENGIVDNADDAVGAVTDVAQAMTEEAEDVNPAVTISTSIDNWIDALNSVLTDFSETIVNRFDSLINTLVGLSSVSVGLPAIAQGRVIPAAALTSANSSTSESEMKGMLESLASQQITYDELRAMLIELFTQYMQTNFYLGDEQIARHANNGNLLLNRRYSIIK